MSEEPVASAAANKDVVLEQVSVEVAEPPDAGHTTSNGKHTLGQVDAGHSDQVDDSTTTIASRSTWGMPQFLLAFFAPLLVAFPFLIIFFVLLGNGQSPCEFSSDVVRSSFQRVLFVLSPSCGILF